MDSLTFRDSLTRLRPAERDAWVDRVFALHELPDDGEDLPRGCVPYLPTSVNTLLHMIELAEVQSNDVFVDVGSGNGRALAVTHLLTGAGAIGLEIQSELVCQAHDLAERLSLSRVSTIQGDATRLTRHIMIGTVFFFYCPFSGERLETVLGQLREIAETRPIRVCTVDLPLPPLPWLTLRSEQRSLAIYSSADP